MGIVFTNNGETTLSAGINDSTLDIPVTSTASFPTVGAGDYFYATLIKQSGAREIVKVESLAGSTYTVAARGADDSSAAAFSAGDRFQLRLPKIVLGDFRDDIDANTTDLAGTTNADTVPAPAGTRMWFYQAAVPATWTIYTTVNDCLVAVKATAGTNGYETNIGDGVEAGSWTPTTHVHTMNAHTHTLAHTHGMPTHVHSMPTHTHTMAHTHTGPSHTHTIAHTHTYSGTTLRDSGSTQREGNDNHDCAEDNHTHTFSGTTSASSAANSGAGGTGNTGASSAANTGAKDPGDTNATDPGDTNSQNTSTTSSVDPGDTNAGTAPSTDRPLAAVGVLGTKD